MSGDGAAIGGSGGGAGGEGGGCGGAGGDAEVVGNGFALGGEGGEAGQADRGGRGGRSPLEVLGLPNLTLPDGTSLYSYGRGGDGGYAGGGGGAGGVTEHDIAGGGGGGGTPWIEAFKLAQALTGLSLDELLIRAGISRDDPRLWNGSGGGRGGDAGGAQGGQGGGASSDSVGDGQDGVVLMIDASTLPRDAQEAIYGDGSDGPAVFDGVAVPVGSVLAAHNVYRLTRPVQYLWVRVEAGVILRPEGHSVRVKDYLEGDGTISASGADGDDALKTGTRG